MAKMTVADTALPLKGLDSYAAAFTYCASKAQ